MKNGDWFRSMSNKEMAKFIYDCGDFEMYCTNENCRRCREAHGGKCPQGDGGLDKCILGDVNDIEFWLEAEKEVR